ncbi:MAG: TonB family protein [Thermoanaerobaculia bacterium]
MTIPDDDAYRNVLAPLRPAESELAFRDGLTGLYNYRLLEQLLEERWGELVVLADRFAIVFLDLDLFMDVNDRYGHLSGDEVLRATGTILRNHFRAGDFVFRYGGDEFVVLLPGADAGEAARLGERARIAMLEAEFVAPEEQQRIEVPVSFSIGVAAYPGDGESGKAVLARADERLYAEKQALKRRIRRRRAVVSVAATLLVGALIAGVLLSIPSRLPDTVAEPPSASAAAPVPAMTSAEDEKLLLARIAELQEEIARLTRDQKESAAMGTAGRAPEIEALQTQVRELSERLDARPVGPAAPSPDVPRQSVERPAPDRAAQEAAPHERPAAPSSPPAATARPESAVRVLPRLLEPVVPRYPAMALDRRAEATIEFNVLIDDEGRVVSATPIGPPKGLGFDDAARAAALSSRWKPGTRGGQPVSMETKLVVQFRIRG